MNREKDRRDIDEIGRRLGLFRGASASEVFKAALNHARTEAGLPPVKPPSTVKLVIINAPKNDH